MSATITVRDETSTGEMSNELVLDFLTDRITVRELIRSRVYQEVKDYNVQATGYFRGLVQPTEAEKTLNGYKLRQARRIDWQQQFEAALDAFNRGYILLVDDRQAESLDQEIDLKPQTTVTFLKLVPLVGG
jgi:glutaredoxin 2